MVAAFAEPMPKLMMVRPLLLVAACIGLSSPEMLQLNICANLST